MPSIFAPPPPDKSEPMPDPQVEPLDEYQKIVAWEFLMLLDLGFSVPQALTLIAIPHFSWHSAERLLNKGFSHEQTMDQLT